LSSSSRIAYNSSSICFSAYEPPISRSSNPGGALLRLKSFIKSYGEVSMLDGSSVVGLKVVGLRAPVAIALMMSTASCEIYGILVASSS
jgi:hypothetical protein